MEDVPGVRTERLWPSRLRWRFRGAWMWPAFLVLTVVDGLLLMELPPYTGAPQGLVPAVLLAGFANLFLIAVLGPLVGRLLRRRRRDLPRSIAANYAGTGLVCALALTALIAGIAHRPAVAAERAEHGAVYAAVHDYVTASAPEYRDGLASVDALALADDTYRACVPGRDPRAWLCLYVDTDQRPAGIRRDPSTEPNSAYRVAGGFR